MDRQALLPSRSLTRPGRVATSAALPRLCSARGPSRDPHVGRRAGKALSRQGCHRARLPPHQGPRAATHLPSPRRQRSAPTSLSACWRCCSSACWRGPPRGRGSHHERCRVLRDAGHVPLNASTATSRTSCLSATTRSPSPRREQATICQSAGPRPRPRSIGKATDQPGLAPVTRDTARLEHV
jgi:hypothetical protein